MAPLSYISSLGANIAYQQFHAEGPISFLWLGGLHSDMQGEKLSFFKGLCRERGWGLTCFDYFGHGVSEGSVAEGSIMVWATNALDLVDKFISSPCIVIGSSMGGWIALLLALRRPEKVLGLMAVNSAPDFTTDLYRSLSDAQHADLERGARLELGLGFPLGKAFFEAGNDYLVLNDDASRIVCPMYLFHGLEDDLVPCSKSIEILKKVGSNDASLVLMKGVGHRLTLETFKREFITRLMICTDLWYDI